MIAIKGIYTIFRPIVPTFLLTNVSIMLSNLSRLIIRCFCFVLALYSLPTIGISQSLEYYFGTQDYDPSIPSPKAILGYDIGQWHISHDQMRMYIAAVDAASERVEVEVIGFTYEQRPLLNIYISSPDNLKRKSNFHQAYQNLDDIQKQSSVSLSTLPSIVYQGYSIHGNESSGGNAAMLMLYYLAAANNPEVLSILENTLIIIDPCMNPDGFNRFASWVNSHKPAQLHGDSRSRELNEAWPGGRTNHYWFDLNRDWLLLTHPESRARVRQFQKWRPLILTDHHEMGSHRTFFFQPGIPSRTNPLTPDINQQLTEDIGRYHAAILDSIGSLYFTKESYDDYYYGKGSTYPDVQGSVGILFEQASSRGHLQETQNGMLTFPFTIRNQVVTSISTLRACVEMRIPLLEYRKNYMKLMREESTQYPVKGYLIQDIDKAKLEDLVDILDHHAIASFAMEDDAQVDGQHFSKDQSIYVPLDQKHHRLIRTIMEPVKRFPDSLFYDVSAWTFPMAFDITIKEIKNPGSLRYKRYKSEKEDTYQLKANDYAAIIPWNQLKAPSVLYKLLSKKIKAYVSTSDLTTGKNTTLSKGALVIPLYQDSWKFEDLRHHINSLCSDHGISIYGATSGWLENMTLGSTNMHPLSLPRIAIIAGEGSSYQDVGEFWHQLDLRWEIPVSVIDQADLSPSSLDNYTHIILAHTNLQGSNDMVDALHEWNKGGGTIIATKNSISYLLGHKLIHLEPAPKRPIQSAESFAMHEASRGSEVLGGAIFKVTMDLDHPLCFGYSDATSYTFKRGTNIYRATSNPLATPVRYSRDSEVSGYVPRSLRGSFDGQAAVTCHKVGGGTVIALQDTPVFRGYWYAGHRLFANALFFDKVIPSSTKQ